MTAEPDPTIIGLDMHCEWALLCDVAEFAEPGGINTTGIFNDFTPSGPYPDARAQADVVALFSADPSEAGSTKVIRIEYRDPGGQQIGFMEEKVVIPSPPRPGARSIVRTIQRIAPLIFPEAGAYSFAIMVDGDVKATISVHARPARPAPSSLN